jgi:hypothetical protein
MPDSMQSCELKKLDELLDDELIYTLTFHKITPGEGAGARFEQLDSH